jgi:hypothetical protein
MEKSSGGVSTQLEPEAEEAPMDEATAVTTPITATTAAPMGTIVVPYSPRQANRLSAFRNILRVVHAQAAPVRAGAPRVYGRYEGDRLAEAYMRLDGKFVRAWNHVAESMYRTEFAHDGALKQAAQDIVREVKREFDGPDALSAAELTALAER